jgi:hypothetical protein
MFRETVGRIGSTALATGMLVVAYACGSSETDNAAPQPDGGSDARLEGAAPQTNDAAGECDPTEDDPANCGECGHSCAGAECRSGVCAAKKIAENQTSPKDVVVAQGRAYWLNGDLLAKLMSAPVDGSAAAAQVRDDDFNALATDGTRLFLSLTSSALLRCTLPGCTDDKYDGTFSHERMVVDGVLLSAGQVYADAGSFESKPGLLRIDRDTLVGTPIVTFPDSTNRAYVIDARDGFVVWAESASRIRGCTHAACTPREFAKAGSPPIQSVATDGKRVYFTQGGSTILACPIEGCTTPDTIVAGIQARDLRVDGNYIYWVVAGGGRIVRCPTSGCGNAEPLTVGTVDGTGFITSMTFDETYVYWTDQSDKVGSVWRAPK